MRELGFGLGITHVSARHQHGGWAPLSALRIAMRTAATTTPVQKAWFSLATFTTCAWALQASSSAGSPGMANSLACCSNQRPLAWTHLTTLWMGELQDTDQLPGLSFD